MLERTTIGLRVIGSGLLLSSVGIHLDLYLTGYRYLPTIGWLFLLQFASGVLLAFATLTIRRRLTSLSAAGFAFATIVGYSLSRFVGLFGFHERPTAAGLVAGLLEFGVVATLGLVALFPHGVPEMSGPHVRGVSSPQRGMRAPGAALVAASALVLVLVSGIGSASHGTTTGAGSAAASSSVVHVTIINFEFQPAHVIARPGEVIAVRNDDSVDHTLTAVPGSVPFGNFDTGDIAMGATKDVNAPSKAGTYDFYCSIHNFMTGELTVS